MTTLAHISDLHFGTESPEIVEGSSRPRVGRTLAGGSERRPDAAGQAEGVHGRTALPGSHPDLPGSLSPAITTFRSSTSLHALRPPARPLPASHRRGRGSLLLDGRGGGTGGSTPPVPTPGRTGRISRAQINDLRRETRSPAATRIEGARGCTTCSCRPLGPVASARWAGRRGSPGRLRPAQFDPALSGHLHRGYTGDIRTHHVDIRRGILVAQAGTAVSHRVRNEANGYNVLELSPQRLGFAVRAWDGRGFHEARFVEYVKSGHDWRPTPSRD